MSAHFYRLFGGAIPNWMNSASICFYADFKYLFSNILLREYLWIFQVYFIITDFYTSLITIYLKFVTISDKRQK